MHDQKIDLSSGGCRQNSRGDIYRGTDFGDVARVFDLEAVERVWPILDFANTQILIRVFDNLIPGLGHIYKGHRVMGALILFLITPTAIAFAILAAIASAGWGILMLIPYWGAVMLHVWAIDDRVTQKPDEGEQY